MIPKVPWHTLNSATSRLGVERFPHVITPFETCIPSGNKSLGSNTGICCLNHAKSCCIVDGIRKTRLVVDCPLDSASTIGLAWLAEGTDDTHWDYLISVKNDSYQLNVKRSCPGSLPSEQEYFHTLLSGCRGTTQNPEDLSVSDMRGARNGVLYWPSSNSIKFHKPTHTFFTLSIKLFSRHGSPKPVSPLYLTLDNFDSLITWVIVNIFEENAASQQRKMYRAYL